MSAIEGRGDTSRDERRPAAQTQAVPTPLNDAIGPHSQAAFELLLDGLPPDAAETHNAVEAIGNVAVANIVDWFEAKMEAQPEALRRELGLLR